LWFHKPRLLDAAYHSAIKRSIDDNCKSAALSLLYRQIMEEADPDQSGRLRVAKIVGHLERDYLRTVSIIWKLFNLDNASFCTRKNVRREQMHISVCKLMDGAVYEEVSTQRYMATEGPLILLVKRNADDKHMQASCSKEKEVSATLSSSGRSKTCFESTRTDGSRIRV
jgi:hypothetical protein